MTQSHKSEREVLSEQEHFTLKASGMSTEWFKNNFEPDCNEKYGGARYLKIMNDHRVAVELIPILLRIEEKLDVVIRNGEFEES